MARYHATIPSACPAPETFDYLANFSNAAVWDPGVQSAEQLDPGQVRAGTRFRLVVPFLGRKLALTYSVTMLEVPRMVTLELASPLLRGTDRIAVTAGSRAPASGTGASGTGASGTASSGTASSGTASSGTGTASDSALVDTAGYDGAPHDDAGSTVSYDAEIWLRGPLRLLDPVLRAGFNTAGARAAAGLTRALSESPARRPAQGS